MGSLTEFKDIPEEERKRLGDIYFHIEDLIKFINKATPPIFNEVFGDRLGEHLWEVYIDHERNFIDLYNHMDKINKTKLMVYIYHKN